VNATVAARADFAAIASWIRPGPRGLDLGCGDGALLAHLQGVLGTRGYGVEIAPENIVDCVANGINVIQADLEGGLSIFADGSFDYVILSQTLQAMRNTERIVKEMLRVGREGIVSFPNFGYWRYRSQVLAGRMPVDASLPYQWYETPNVHLCTMDDFELFCSHHGVRIHERVVMTGERAVTRLPNLLGRLAVYRIGRQV
jgi:methionine biosynthesis protein MetW